MNFDIRLTELAEKDLRSVFEYIAFDLLAFESAKNQLIRLEDAILSLDFMPERYQKLTKEPWCSRGIRSFPVDKYQIFYYVNLQDKVVTILRIMYGGKDKDKELDSLIFLPKNIF